jgi:hypothetical protein
MTSLSGLLLSYMIEDCHVVCLHGKVKVIIGSIKLFLLCLEADLMLGEHIMIQQGLTFHAWWFKLEPLETVIRVYYLRLHLTTSATKTD